MATTNWGLRCDTCNVEGETIGNCNDCGQDLCDSCGAATSHILVREGDCGCGECAGRERSCQFETAEEYHEAWREYRRNQPKEVREKTAPQLCSICRREHGLEVIHACE
jgi:hypothetical protein